MAEAKDISNHAEPGDRAFGSASQKCILPQEQIDISQGSMSSGVDGGSFDCNVCEELAQDPVVTLCGHLFCWPCLYKRLHIHSACQECPVCKAFVTQESVVPLYGRGNPGYSDPRKKSFPELSVPQRPAGPRPAVARPPAILSPRRHFNAVAGPSSPVATVRASSSSLSAAFGFFPSLFGLQVHGASDAIDYGPGYPFGWPIGWHNAHHNAHLHTHPHATHHIPNSQQAAAFSQLFLVVILLVAVWILVM